MKIAGAQASIELCPYVEEDVKAELSEASAPPIIGVTIGSGDDKLKIGEETVLYRHDRTFVNPTGVAIHIKDSLDDATIEKEVLAVAKHKWERVGQELKADLIAVESCSTKERFKDVVAKITSMTSTPLVLMAADIETMKAGVEVACANRPLIYAATLENHELMAALATEFNCPLVAKDEHSLENLADLTEKLKGHGVKEIVLDPGTKNAAEVFKNLVHIRRSALKKKFRPLGYPVITFPNMLTDDSMLETVIAAVQLVKYSGIVVLSSAEAWKILPLLVLRQNIYTDPQRPLTVTEGIYEIGKPDANSPVLITTNFSLTYFIVSSEMEASKVDSWLLIMDAEGLSVLTAWAAGKFVPEKIGKFVNNVGIKDKISHNKITIPGYVAQISGELEDELSDWKIIVGPREATELPAYLKGWSAN